MQMTDSASDRRILVINPNSNDAVTRGLEGALAPPLARPGVAIDCRTLAEGPFGIQSQADVEQVALPLRRPRAARGGRRLCHRLLSDPRPPRLPRGDRPAGARHRRMRHPHRARPGRPVRRDRGGEPLDPAPPAGLAPDGGERRLAGERALEMTVAETASGTDTLARMIAVGRDLRDRDGAGVIVWAAPAWRSTARPGAGTRHPGHRPGPGRGGDGDRDRGGCLTSRGEHHAGLGGDAAVIARCGGWRAKSKIVSLPNRVSSRIARDDDHPSASPVSSATIFPFGSQIRVPPVR